MVLGGRAFGRKLGHKGGALVNEISTLIKDSQESCLTLFSAMWGYSKKSVYEPVSGTSPEAEFGGVLILDLPNCEK